MSSQAEIQFIKQSALTEIIPLHLKLKIGLDLSSSEDSPTKPFTQQILTICRNKNSYRQKISPATSYQDAYQDNDVMIFS